MAQLSDENPYLSGNWAPAYARKPQQPLIKSLVE
jgi:hypothetical protein